GCAMLESSRAGREVCEKSAANPGRAAPAGIARTRAGALPPRPTREGRILMNRLEGKVAVVTGASKGIGASIAWHLATEGASVVVNYATSRAGAEAVVRRINDEGGRAVAIQADLSNPDDVRRLFAETRSACGKLDILVNN